MQHHFVGDVGDFGKYGLLRALTGVWPDAEPRLSLGVVWYLPASAVGSASDGQKLTYMNQPEHFRGCDPRLYDALGSMFDGGERSLGAVAASGVLGSDTTFVDSPVPRGLAWRDSWFQQVVDAVRGRDVVFLDPDKGLAPASAGPSSPEHAYVRELKALVQRGYTLVVYHHLGRTATHPVQMRDWVDRLTSELRPHVEPHVLWYRRGTARAYFVLPADAHAEVIGERLERFGRSRWFGLGLFTPLAAAPLRPFRDGEAGANAVARPQPAKVSVPAATDGVARLLAAGESQTVEFKATASLNLHTHKKDRAMEHVIVKTVCGFLNAEGGKLLIGVDDDANVLGLTEDMQIFGKKPNRDSYELSLRQRLDSDLSVPTAGFVRISFDTVEGLDVCVVSTSPYSKPVFAKPKAGGGTPTDFWVRVGNSTNHLQGNDMLEYQTNRWGR